MRPARLHGFSALQIPINRQHGSGARAGYDDRDQHPLSIMRTLGCLIEKGSINPAKLEVKVTNALVIRRCGKSLILAKLRGIVSFVEGNHWNPR